MPFGSAGNSQENVLASEPFGGNRGITGTVNTSEDDERELIDRAQAGEAIAFEQLAEQHAARLWRCALALGKDGHWAEDLAQETLVEAWRSLATFRWSLPVLHLALRHSTAPVLERTATPERRQAFRTRCSWPRAMHCAARPIAPPRRPKMPAGFAERWRACRKSIAWSWNSVSSRGRRWTRLRRLLAVRLGTVKSRLHHALEKLRQMNLAVNLFTSSRETQGEQTMNDLHHPCEPWAEPISLAAAGCLSPDEEREIRRHIETCSDCRERFRQLTQLCGALAEAQLPVNVAEIAIVERVMSAVASEESRRPLVRTRSEMIQPSLLTRSLDTWRWIMRSPVSRVAAAAIFVLAVTGVALWFHGGGATPRLRRLRCPDPRSEDR